MQRAVKFIRFLPELGFDPVIITGPAEDERSFAPGDETLASELPTDLEVYRVKEPARRIRRLDGAGRALASPPILLVPVVDRRRPGGRTPRARNRHHPRDDVSVSDHDRGCVALGRSWCALDCGIYETRGCSTRCRFTRRVFTDGWISD